jgi:hypothetical protein
MEHQRVKFHVLPEVTSRSSVQHDSLALDMQNCVYSRCGFASLEQLANAQIELRDCMYLTLHDM